MSSAVDKRTVGVTAASAFGFVLAMGLVNLFADTKYEGGGSINGPFLGKLGAGSPGTTTGPWREPAYESSPFVVDAPNPRM